ncbi:hypothetical protein EOPP23_11005 [Endozoicomonas sp. OPT23]|uniref:hypothetical protein n=1 Tax=Endozoicomonas sp. OPT23 TaxID=2072845 RepID=UPI00129B0ADC|nr:hypothetical protein [Endozoicomonas sp. OPT23]MRI33514.1 hypothetical protein [Endozoicomonas sp. OPT23]
MVIKNSVIIKNVNSSRLIRSISFLAILGTSIFTLAVSLNYFYKPIVDRYFTSGESGSEQILSIHSGNYRVTTKKDSLLSFTDVLSNELGDYKSHKPVGWHADFSELSHPDSFPFVMIYRVDYERGATEQEFVFAGLFERKLIGRQVRLLP